MIMTSVIAFVYTSEIYLLIVVLLKNL